MYKDSQGDFERLIQQGYQLKIEQYFSRGWEIFSQNMGGFIGFFCLVFIINLSLSFIPLLGGIASMVVGGPLNAGFTLVALNIAKGKKAIFSDFFKGFDDFLPVFLASFLIGTFTFLGFICLIIPGIYLAIAYVFTMPIILDKKIDFWQAMEASRKIITKNWFAMFAFVIVLGLINFCGALLLGLGLLFTAPWSGCAIVAAYEDIVGLRISSDSTNV